MRIECLSVWLATVATATHGFVLSPNALPGFGVFRSAKEWDNDDFLDSLNTAPPPPPASPESTMESGRDDGGGRFKEIFDQGRQAAQETLSQDEVEGPSAGMPVSFDDLAADLLAPLPPPPNPYAAYPPPPQQGYPPADPNNPYPPPPPPQGYPPADPNNPYAAYPYPPYPYPPPPPQGADPNDPNAQTPPPPPYPYPPYPYPPPDPNNPYAAAYPPPPQSQAPPEPNKSTQVGKPVGRNRDADQIANAADLYFAQLKLDSTIRAKAFHAGDYDTSNAAFEDDRVKKLADALKDNPYIQLERKRYMEEQEKLYELVTSDDVLPDDIDVGAGPGAGAATTTGVSYREKLAQKKRAKQGGGAAAEVAPTPPIKEATPPPPPPVVEARVETVSPPAPAVEVAKDTSLPPPPPPPPPPPAAEIQEAPPAVKVVELPAATVVEAPDVDDVDSEEYALESRKQVRAVMGYVLKHRGGRGFGAGRLKFRHDRDGLVQGRDEILKMLRREVGAETTREAPPVVVDDALAGHLACVEAAVASYRAGAAGLAPLRNALLGAANELNRLLAEEQLDAGTAPSPSETIPELGDEARLRDARDALVRATGDGKFGLGALTPDEARDLAAKVRDVKDVLAGELSLGQESRQDSSPPEPAAAAESSSKSKYQQMLERARAEQAARKTA